MTPEVDTVRVEINGEWYDVPADCVLEEYLRRVREIEEQHRFRQPELRIEVDRE